VAGRQAAHGAEEGAVRRRRPGHEVSGGVGLVQIILHAGRGERRVDVAREDEAPAVSAGVIERPGADRVPRAEQQPLCGIPHREGVVAVQPQGAVPAPAPVSPQDQFAIGGAGAFRSAKAEGAGELGAVVQPRVGHGDQSPGGASGLPSVFFPVIGPQRPESEGNGTPVDPPRTSQPRQFGQHRADSIRVPGGVRSAPVVRSANCPRQCSTPAFVPLPIEAEHPLIVPLARATPQHAKQALAEAFSLVRGVSASRTARTCEGKEGGYEFRRESANS